MDSIDPLLAAIAQQRAGRLPEAEAAYRALLGLAPDCAPALFLLGLLALSTGRAAEAAALLARADALRPGHPGQVLALCRALLAGHRPGDVPAAVAPLLADVAQPPAVLAEAHFLHGSALNALARFGAAAQALSLAVAANPSHASAHANLGNALADLDRPEAAEAALREAVRLDPMLVEAHVSLGHVLGERGATAEAIAACQRAIDLRPDLAAAHWNQGIACLLAGRFEEGWARYEWRKRRFPHAFAALSGPHWQGEALDGRHILVLAEQGFGDAIQLARYLPLLAARGARVSLRCAAPLRPLLRQLAGVAVLGDGPLPAYDVWVDQMSLPGLFATTLDTIPGPSPCLRAPPALAASWRRRLPPDRRVGLVWAGNPAHSNDRRRSMPPDAVAALATSCAPRLVGLQVGPRAGELVARGVPELGRALASYADTAAVLASLDLLVTVDTSVAHLAGALGVPTWVMLPYAPDWRWMRDRLDSPWYPSVRLFRQERAGDWSGVVREVTAVLARQRSPAMAE
jgi:tetratricopeptide (TPR) repeat protein